MEKSAEFGEQLILKFMNERMDDLGLSYVQVSEAAGMNYTTLYRNMTGVQPFSLRNYLKVLGALDLRPYLINECGVTYSQVRRWINYTIDDSSSIKTDHLVIISSYLICSVDEIINKEAFQNA